MNRKRFWTQNIETNHKHAFTGLGNYCSGRFSDYLLSHIVMSSNDNPVALLKIMITISFEMADIMSILYPEPRKTRTILFISGHSIKTVHTQAMALENRQAVAC